MRIEHLAIWVGDLESMMHFYCTYFDGTANAMYHNPAKDFRSYFITFENGARLELMHKPSLPVHQDDATLEYQGIAHLAVSVGSATTVNVLTEQLRKDGYQVIGEPRTTGDGYYESIILDPEGNRIEITI